MVVDNERPLKRMKTKVITDLYDFVNFLAIVGDKVVVSEPFRSNVHHFLSNHAHLTFPHFPDLSPTAWQIVFRVKSLVDGSDPSLATIALDIIEEDVTQSRNSVYCDQCRVVGESIHGLSESTINIKPILKQFHCNRLIHL